MRRLAKGVLIVTALLACATDPVSVDVTPYAGAYTLITMNGNTLPYALSNTPTLTLLATSGTSTLLASGSFVDITRYQRTQNSVTDFPTDTLRGTFTVRGQTATFTTTSGSLLTGTMGTSEFTVEGSSAVFLYKK